MKIYLVRVSEVRQQQQRARVKGGYEEMYNYNNYFSYARACICMRRGDWLMKTLFTLGGVPSMVTSAFFFENRSLNLARKPDALTHTHLAKKILLRILLLIERASDIRLFSLVHTDACNLIIALYSPKDVTTYGYYFLFSVSSSGYWSRGNPRESREYIVSREGQCEVMRILRPFLSSDFLQFGISLIPALRMNLWNAIIVDSQ